MIGLLVVISFGLAVGLHAVVCRSRWQANVVTKFVGSGGICGAFLAVQLIYTDGLTLETLTGLVAYSLICELYVFLFTLSSNSISSSILTALAAQPLTQAELEVLQNDSHGVDWRGEQLIRRGFLTRAPDGYVITDSGRRLLKLSARLRSFFHPYDVLWREPDQPG